ncbi:MAG: hypothetical protein ACJ75E_02705 [Actinomycetes bacterium]
MDQDAWIQRLDAHMERGNRIMERSDLTMRRSNEVMLRNEVAFRELRDFLADQTLALRGLRQAVIRHGDLLERRTDELVAEGRAQRAALFKILDRLGGNGGPAEGTA